MRRFALPAYYRFDTGPTSATQPAFESMLLALPEFGAFFGQIEEELADIERWYGDSPDHFAKYYSDDDLADAIEEYGDAADWMWGLTDEVAVVGAAIELFRNRYHETILWLKDLGTHDKVERNIGMPKGTDPRDVEPLGVFWCIEGGDCGEWAASTEESYTFHARHNPDGLDWFGTLAVHMAYGDVLPEIRYLRGAKIFVLDCDVGWRETVDIEDWRTT